eukprot:tig00020824_g14226.t1
MEGNSTSHACKSSERLAQDACSISGRLVGSWRFAAAEALACTSHLDDADYARVACVPERIERPVGDSEAVVCTGIRLLAERVDVAEYAEGYRPEGAPLWPALLLNVYYFDVDIGEVTVQVDPAFLLSQWGSPCDAAPNICGCVGCCIHESYAKNEDCAALWARPEVCPAEEDGGRLVLRPKPQAAQEEAPPKAGSKAKRQAPKGEEPTPLDACPEPEILERWRAIVALQAGRPDALPPSAPPDSDDFAAAYKHFRDVAGVLAKLRDRVVEAERQLYFEESPDSFAYAGASAAGSGGKFLAAGDPEYLWGMEVRPGYVCREGALFKRPPYYYAGTWQEGDPGADGQLLAFARSFLLAIAAHRAPPFTPAPPDESDRRGLIKASLRELQGFLDALKGALERVGEQPPAWSELRGFEDERRLGQRVSTHLGAAWAATEGPEDTAEQTAKRFLDEEPWCSSVSARAALARHAPLVAEWVQAQLDLEETRASARAARLRTFAHAAGRAEGQRFRAACGHVFAELGRRRIAAALEAQRRESEEALNRAAAAEEEAAAKRTAAAKEAEAAKRRRALQKQKGGGPGGAGAGGRGRAGPAGSDDNSDSEDEAPAPVLQPQPQPMPPPPAPRAPKAKQKAAAAAAAPAPASAPAPAPPVEEEVDSEEERDRRRREREQRAAASRAAAAKLRRELAEANGELERARRELDEAKEVRASAERQRAEAEGLRGVEERQLRRELRELEDEISDLKQVQGAEQKRLAKLQAELAEARRKGDEERRRAADAAARAKRAQAIAEHERAIQTAERNIAYYASVEAKYTCANLAPRERGAERRRFLNGSTPSY